MTIKEWCVVSHEPGPFRVTRWCCTSGNCIECNGGCNQKRRVRVVQMDGLNAKAAEVVRKGWDLYEARVES